MLKKTLFYLVFVISLPIPPPKLFIYQFIYFLGYFLFGLHLTPMVTSKYEKNVNSCLPSTTCFKRHSKGITTLSVGV